MSSSVKVNPGSYTAKIRDYFVDKTFHGHYRVNVSFNVKADEKNPYTTQILTWSGSLSSPKSKQLVMKTLAILGLKSESMLGAVAKGRSSGALNLEQEVLVEVVVEEKETKDTPPKKYMWTTIKYVNSMDGIAGRDHTEYDEFESFVNDSGMKEDFSRMKNDQTDGAQSSHDDQPPHPGDEPYVEIPF